MTDLTRKGVLNNMEWTKAQEKAHLKLKGALTSYATLHLPVWTNQFHVRTHASNLGLGAILMQEVDGPWSMILQQYRFIIRAIKGNQNHAADYKFSRTDLMKIDVVKKKKKLGTCKPLYFS